ncbi:hypothetical protein AB0H92_38410 [Streptomyces phaeochromogenes]|uniref:hypothetical protein n=1 Tax=Streptomyces phaeochromogenes TaxID=1923 RepID=UPI0033DAD645
MTGYLSTLRVDAVPACPDVSRVAWSGTFTPVGVSDTDAEELFHAIHADGLVVLLKTVSA